MNAERWQQIDELLDAVLEIPNERREEFLSEKCSGDDDLRKEVLSLLEAQKETDSFLEKSAMNLAAKEIAHDQTTVADFTILGGELGNYCIERRLGAGGMGEIFLAHDKKLSRKVALKILPVEFILDADRVKRFEREAKAISALNHPNIVTIYDFGQTNGINYIVTEFIEGSTVREIIKTKPPLKEILSIISQICEALAAAHAAGIMHRDIKPENIMVRPDGYVKVLDFGLAKLNPQADSIHVSLTNYTQKGMIVGTLAYMSPEQVSDDHVDHRTDLWSVGVVLYEMLTGTNPFKGANRQATLNAILNYNPPLISEWNSSLPAELDRILEKALEKDPDVSYQTAAEIRADLRRVRREIDSSTSLRSLSAASKNERKTEAANRKDYLLPAFGVLALALVGFGVWFFVFRTTKPDAVDWSRATKMQLTDQAGTEMFPTLAPDGKSFIFAAKANGDYDLFWQRVGDKKARNITEDSTADDTQPAFSPDGERVAFRSNRETAGIYQMSATGENVRRICDFGFHPAWSPDGKEIVVSAFERDLPDVRTESAIWVVNVETGAKRLLSEDDGFQPVWSPNGKYIAYWFMPPNVGRRDIAVVSKNGGEPTVITAKDGTTNWNPVWSADGAYLYFASDRGGNMNFWRVAFDAASGKIAGAPEAVVVPSKYSRHLAFSGDGKRLIYVSTDNKSNLQAVEFDPQTEKIVGEPFWVTRGDHEVSRPELSPDGKQFVYRLPRRTQDDIVVVNRDGTNPRDLTNDVYFDRYPRWSPDGKRIAFASDRSGVYEIWTINADGTNLRQMTFTGRDGTSFPLWSPDGSRILYRCVPSWRTVEENKRSSCVIEANKNWTEQTPQVLPDYKDERQRFVAWNWSPDGTRLAGSFSGEPMDVGFYSIPENRFELVAKMDDYPMWLPDGRRLIYGFENKIFIADTDKKQSKEIGIRPMEEIQSIGISRDGRLIYYTLFSSESDIWLLDVSQNQ